MPRKLKFVGPLHAYKDPAQKVVDYSWLDKLGRFDKTILITQGTFEPDHSKLIIPALEALKHQPYLLIVATGYHNTAVLRKEFEQDNIVIEDFIDFYSIMPHVDVYITNGGYGGTLLAIEHGLPIVAAGVNEGKNEICSRVGYFKLGVNLKTEKPTSQKIKAAVDSIVASGVYKANVEKLRDEFKRYDSNKLSAQYILDVIEK